MPFSHDTEHSLACVVDLVNSAPTCGTAEMLPDLDALSALVARHDISDVSRLTVRDLREVHELREELRPLFDCGTDTQACTLLNRLISQAAVTPRMTDHDGYSWHIHYFAPGASLRDHLTVDCGMAMAQVVASGERERLRRCEAPDCDQVLVDLSRNRSKRYCDARTCGNRLHVAAYRERQRAATS